MTDRALQIGLLLNPVAGLGGRVALKGSDGKTRQALATKRGGQPRAAGRLGEFLDALAAADCLRKINWYAWGGLGAELLENANLSPSILGSIAGESSSRDTKLAAQEMLKQKVDLLVFVGGDGTAVDLLEVVDQSTLCLGIPAGVKMHSGVFAASPQSAAQIVNRILTGELVAARENDVVDFVGPEGVEKSNDQSGRETQIRTQVFGQFKVPEAGGFMQHTKAGGRESEPLAVAEISAEFVERLPIKVPLILGPGGTMYAVKQALNLVTPTLRGFDVLKPSGEWLINAAFDQLEPMALTAQVAMSFTGQQGFLLGRGNLELTPVFLSNLDPDRLEIVATRSKVLALAGRPIMVDCESPELDRKFTGLYEVTAGYEDRLIYRVQGASTITLDVDHA